MATYSKIILSGSTNGKGILISTTADAGNTIHTAVAGVSSMDEIWLYAANIDTAAVVVSVEWGGNTSPGDIIPCSVLPGIGPVLIIPGLILQNSLLVKVYASVANKIIITGYVNRIV